MAFNGNEKYQLNMKKIIYLKYGELILKGKNRKDFINCLYSNIKNALQ
jgi:thiamine biosynthesis protein ThiI